MLSDIVMHLAYTVYRRVLSGICSSRNW